MYSKGEAVSEMLRAFTGRRKGEIYLVSSDFQMEVMTFPVS